MSRVVSWGLTPCLLAALALAIHAQTPGEGGPAAAIAPGASVSRGVTPDPRVGHPTTGCENKEKRFNALGMPARVGEVTSSDGKTWTVPLTVEEGPFAVDYYNDCNGPGEDLDYASKLKTVVIDPDGVEITAFIHADNYFELSVNGTFVGRDSIGMVPFNTAVVRFRARYPMTYAIKAVDWETHQGVGLEYANFNVGDAGFIAWFSDGNRTSADWRIETFYIAPLDDPSCVRVTPQGRDSTFCSQATRPNCALKEPLKLCQALHFPVPADWKSPRFNDSRWAMATTWPPAVVTDDVSYTRVTKIFGDAEFIWTKNLKLDNLVLARYAAKGPRTR
jgi:hypothetical protein